MKVLGQTIVCPLFQIRIYSECSIADCSYTTKNGKLCIYCLTASGDLYMVEGSKIHTHNGCEDQSGSNENVFSDLLERCDEEKNIDIQLSSETVYVLKQEDQIGKLTERVISLCVSQHYAVIATKTQNEYKVLLYQMPSLGQQMSIDKRKMLHFPKRMTTVDSSVILKLVCVADDTRKCTLPSDSLTVDSLLFKQLFGETVALLQSPVCLISNSDGNIYFAPLAYFETYEDDIGYVKPTSEFSLSSRWKVLCRVADCVSDIFTITPGYKTCERFDHVGDCTKCLGICNADGSLTVFAGNSAGPVPATINLCLPGPVLALCCHCNKIYSSTGHCLYESSIVYHSSSVGKKCDLIVESTRTIDCPNVVHMMVDSSSKFFDCEASSCALHCVLANGETCQINPTENVRSASSKTGSIGNLLTAIDKVKHEVDDTRLVKEQLINWLGELTTAVYLIGGYLDSKNSENVAGSESTESRPESSVTCSVSTHMLFGKMPVLRCELSHSLPQGLSSHWTVSVSLLPVSTDCRDKAAIVTETLHIEQDWKSGEVLSFEFSLTRSFALHGCSIVVKMLLNLDHLADGGQKVLSIPVLERELDILSFLKRKKELDGNSLNCLSRTEDVQKSLLALANGRGGLDIGQNGSSFPKNSAVKSICVKHSVPVHEVIANSTEDTFLKDLLSHVANGAGNKQNVIQEVDLCTLFGELVFVGASSPARLSPGQDGKPLTTEITVMADPQISAAVHLAVQKRMKSTEKHFPMSLTSLEGTRAVLQDLQRLSARLEHTNTVRGKHCEATSSLLALYEQLRCLCV